ncbi:hypothetical protein HDC36_003892 [Xanthomonas sp. JAI131]|uniref:hypothetical protein n=1 Tax=Xanthomonas sp. JAI131 TaxID=2723067 RepID=UPI0015C9EE69|nr:hypothetical protein [Xanthomonas sp. JAI131]NYF22416.1 hypothetical protein [Xanthomonas sp. JAI131]
MNNVLAIESRLHGTVGLGAKRYYGAAMVFLTIRGNVYLQYGFARQSGEYRDTQRK